MRGMHLPQSVPAAQRRLISSTLAAPSPTSAPIRRSLTALQWQMITEQMLSRPNA